MSIRRGVKVTLLAMAGTGSQVVVTSPWNTYSVQVFVNATVVHSSLISAEISDYKIVTFCLCRGGGRLTRFEMNGYRLTLSHPRNMSYDMKKAFSVQDR